MTPLGNGLFRVVIFVIPPAVVVLIVLNIYLGGKLREFAPLYLDKYSKLSGLDLRASKAGLDPFFRIKLSGVSAADPSLPNKGLAEIGTLTVDPGIVSSLINGRFTIKEIVIDKPVFRYDGGSVKNILDMIEGGNGAGGGISIGLEKIRLNHARMELSSGAVFSSDELVVRISRRGNGIETDINMDGDIALFGIGTTVAGTVKIVPGSSSGKFRLVADKSQPGSTPVSLVSVHNLRGIAEVSFNASGTIDSSGDLTIFSLDDKNHSEVGELGKLDYALVYDREKDTARVSKLGFDVMHAVNGVLSGDVKDVTGGLVFDIHGSASSGDLKNLPARLPAIDPKTLTGSIRFDDLGIVGSAIKNDLRLTGKADIDGIGLALADGSLRVSGLDCVMEVNQHLEGNSGFGFSSRGLCKADEFIQRDIGEIRGLAAATDIEIGGPWIKSIFSLSDISGVYMDGTVSGSLKFTSGKEENGISGVINGKGLDLGKAPKSILPFNMGGTAGNITADIVGKPGLYKAGIAFSVNDFILRSESGRALKVASAGTAVPLDLEYTEDAADKKEEGSRGEAHGKIVIKDKGLSYQNLSFGDYLIDSGRVEDLLLTLDPGGDWSVSMSSAGTGFKVLGMDTGLSQFKEHIEIRESGRRGFRGTIEGTDGRFKSIVFPALSAEYVFDGDRIGVSKLSAEVSPAGELKTDNLAIALGPEKGGYPYKITLKDGTFSGYEGGITADGISGSFTVNSPDTGQAFWGGTASAAKADIFSAMIEGLRLDVSPTANGIVLKEITGKFINGLLIGKIEIVTSESSTRIVTDLGVENASSKSGGLDISLGRADFNFSGALTEDSLPQGTGKFSFIGAAVKKDGLDMLYSGGFDTRTSGETLLLENGFIRNKDKNELRFTGEMENTAGGDRDLRLAIPDFNMVSALAFMSPLLPPVIRGGSVSGSAGLELEIKNLFGPERSWNGVLSFYRAAFAASMGGADLYLRGINGTVRLKDEGEGGNALASLVNNKLKLDKNLYNEYFRTFKESNYDDDTDRIKIDGIEYGILKFDNVDCALTADTKKITIKKLSAEIFGGRIYSSGELSSAGAGGLYNFSFLFNDISLDAISRSLAPTEEYITGRVNGLVWLTGEGDQLGTIDGPFEFWSVSSQKEPRSIGKALLDKLGAKERLILGSTRSYDNGEISGYINKGVITFKKFDISNSVLGIRNLSIQADPVKNSISISHLVSVIREIARRSQSGGPTIETK